jgi:L-cysteine S-thiosulfotransferase
LSADNATNLADILAIGKKRWMQKFADGKSLAHCFPNGGRRIAASYPQFDTAMKQVVTFEAAINRCLQLHREPAIDPTNAANYAAVMGPLSAYARSLSDGQKLSVRLGNPGALKPFEAGRRLFRQRIGQQNFACASCHVQNAGRSYGNAGLAPAVGQAVNWPKVAPGGAVRTLQTQFQRCMTRTGAVPFETGSEELNNLEFYLAYLSNGLPLRPLGAVR